MARIENMATALPPHVVPQSLARAAYTMLFAGTPAESRLAALFDRCGVEQRHFAFPPTYYLSGKGFDERNADYVEKALDLAEEAARACLERAGVEPGQVDHLILVTTTGLATPSLDALLVPRLGLRADVRRWPLFGLGCAGGAGALVRADEVLRGHPDQRALVISVELCGQSFTPKATDAVDAVGGALFGDGAAAVLVAGEDTGAQGPRVVASHSVLFEDSKHIMGWRFTSDGMRLVLAQEVTELVRERFRPVAEEFLATIQLGLGDITHWILHPGGRRIIEAYEEALGCVDGALSWTRDSLAKVGNVSSASVLFVLDDVLKGASLKAGDRAFLAAPGPGFGVEMMVIAW